MRSKWQKCKKNPKNFGNFGKTDVFCLKYLEKVKKSDLEEKGMISMSASNPLVGALIRAIAASKPIVGERDGKARVDENGQPVYEVRTLLFFENQKLVQAKVSCLSRISSDIAEGDDLNIEGLSLRFYSSNNGGTGVSFWAEKISPASSSPSKSGPSSSTSSAA